MQFSLDTFQKSLLRIEGGIPPLVELLNFPDVKVHRAAAGALRTVSFRNDENKDQVLFSLWLCFVLFGL